MRARQITAKQINKLEELWKVTGAENNGGDVGCDDGDRGRVANGDGGV